MSCKPCGCIRNAPGSVAISGSQPPQGFTMPVSLRSGDRPMPPPAAPPTGDRDAHFRSLLERCSAADSTALQQLYEAASPILFACLIRILRRRALAEEALQDVFVSIWQRAGQFSATRGRPMAWMISIARYRAIDLLRHERSAPALVPDLPERAEPEDDSREGLPWMTATGLLERCLTLLNERQRNCLELAFVAGN